MQLLYLDASGDPGWPPPAGRSRTRWYVLAGLSLDDEKWNLAHRRADAILDEYFGSRDLLCRELRYSSLISGKHPYDRLGETERKHLADATFDLLTEIDPVLFAAAIDKGAYREEHGETAISPKIWALRLVAPEFDAYLSRKGATGMMIMDAEETRKDRELKQLIKEARKRGITLPVAIAGNPPLTRTKLPNLIESVIFVDSEDSRLIQLVDFCAHAIWSHYEKGKSSRYLQIQRYFDHADGTARGLRVWPMKKA